VRSPDAAQRHQRVHARPGPRPCIAVGETSLQIASGPWHADLHVSFTDDPAAATVRVQLTDSAEAADFVVVDDVDSAEADACEASPATQWVAISTEAGSNAPVIYLSPDGPADYRIHVRSKTFTARSSSSTHCRRPRRPPRRRDRLALNVLTPR
jgi:hypothetical protein